MSSEYIKEDQITADIPRRKRGPNYKNLWPLALGEDPQHMQFLLQFKG